MTQTEVFINDRGVVFKIERSGQIISESKGLLSLEENSSKKIIRFFHDSYVQSGDWVISPASERFYITDAITHYAFGMPSELRAYYQTTAEYNSKHETPSISFHIENATNSMIGTQSNFTMNINGSIQEAREQIQSSNSSDKEELQQIIDLLEQISKSQEPIKHGMLSRFSAVIQRNSWITSPIASIVLNMLLNQVHTVLP